jgi:hypothetical protein
VTGLVSGALTLAVVLGVLTQDEADAVSAGVIAVLAVITTAVAALAPLVAALHARGQVTPVSDPAKVIDGELVRLGPLP